MILIISSICLIIGLAMIYYGDAMLEVIGAFITLVAIFIGFALSATKTPVSSKEQRVPAVIMCNQDAGICYVKTEHSSCEFREYAEVRLLTSTKVDSVIEVVSYNSYGFEVKRNIKLIYE